MKHGIIVSMMFAAAALSACLETDEPQVGTSAAALTRTVTIRRGTFGTVADTTLSAAALTTNFGARKTLRVSAKNEALLRFDLSSIPANAVVQSADLTLAINGGEEEHDDDGDDGDHEGHAIAPIKLRRVTAAWAEGTVTYRSFDQRFAPAVAATLVLANRTSAKTVDVRALVQGWVAGTYPNFGLILTTTGKQHTLVVSSEHASVARRPRLELRYVVPDDHCAANPCAHGTCTNTVQGFTCACDPGFDGATCAHDLDDCAASPCQNGGACTDGVAGFSCACAPGFAGTTCATNIDDCAAAPCQHGGTCTDGVDSHTCACPAGTSGADCEIVDVCSATSNPCQNGGSCTLLPGNTYACTCPIGFAGANCELDPNDCPAVDPCSGHGTCADGLASYTCACDPGYTGTDCETVIDHCVPGACANGGTCTSTATGFTCACAAGYDGPTCADDLDDCAGSPCANGGACIDGVDSFTCACPIGRGGPTCEDVCQARTVIADDPDLAGANWSVVSDGAANDLMFPAFGVQLTDMFEDVVGMTQQVYVNERYMAFAAGSYDPAVSGPLGRIDYSFDAQDRTGFPSVGLQLVFTLMQDGHVYFPSNAFDSVNLTQVSAPGLPTTIAETRLGAGDFVVHGAGPFNPDFSAAGAPITFGYRALVLNFAQPSGARQLAQFALDHYAVKALPAALDCDDVDECAANLDDCAPAPAGVCTNTVASFTCSCAAGFAGDGVTCLAQTALSLSAPVTVPYGAPVDVSATLTRVGPPATPIVGQLVVFELEGLFFPTTEVGVTDVNGLATVSFQGELAGFYQVRASYPGGADAPADAGGALNVVCDPGYGGPLCDQYVCDPSCAACSGPAPTQCTACDPATASLDPATGACVPLAP
ncbi:MAG TPA: DNRLRE domain-containing protein [Kofleriaceae bacterium]|nr:DNRLRE domain-containing protein [Kofleriaceae bacterium]